MAASVRRRYAVAAALFALVSLGSGSGVATHGAASSSALAKPKEVDRSPVDLLLTKDQRRLIAANQTSGTLSVVDIASGQALQELACGERPTAMAMSADEKRLVVSSTYTGELLLFRFDGERLTEDGRVFVNFEPRGVAVAPDGKTAYAALTSGRCVAVVDLDKRELTKKIGCGRWPRYLALTPDGARLAVGCSGDGGVCILDLADEKKIHQDDFLGLNIGMMAMDQAGQHVYFPFMVYRSNPITTRNIQIGWVLASRLGRLEVGKAARRAAFSLDKQGEAVADPQGIALSPKEDWLVCAASGSQELLVYRMEKLPFEKYGSTDHLPSDLLNDSNRFFRVHLGGRPMACRFAADGRRVYVADYIQNCVHVVDLERRKPVRSISLGGPAEPSLARQGEALFYDGKKSLDQWYSCHTCHYEGHANNVAMDTLNDGRFGNFKTVPSLRNVTETAPYTWHGWQKKLDDAVSKSFSETMLGREPNKEEVAAVIAYLATLKCPPNPYRTKDGGFSPAAQRGKAVFESEKAGCARCHSGPYFTDGKLHEVGLSDRRDVYKGWNPPSLLGVHDRMLYLHDGRAKSLEEVLTGPHSPAKVTKKGELTGEELADLIEYLKAL